MWPTYCLVWSQGTIRQNLDPLDEFSDRDMIRVLKDVHLWEILCGISLSQAKEGESPRRNRPTPEFSAPWLSTDDHHGVKQLESQG